MSATPHPGEAVLEPKTCAYCGVTIEGEPYRAWCDGNRHHAGPACSLHHLHLIVIEYLSETCRTLRSTPMALASPQDRKVGADPLITAWPGGDRVPTCLERAL
jgi:hypothetical protein